MSDQQRAGNLDDDTLGEDVAPEEPLGVEDDGTTAAEEAAVHSIPEDDL